MSIKSLLIPALNRPPVQERIPLLAQGDAVPRILHQIGMRPAFQDRQLPPRLQANVDHLRAMNPGWDYRFYGDDEIADFIQAHYPALVWRYYERIDPRYGAARADLFRYLLMYKVGGVYLDIKSSATRPLDEIVRPEDRYVISQWNTADGQYESWGLLHDLRHVPGGEYQQWHIIAAPGHPFLKAVIEQVLSNIDKYDPHLHQTGKFGVVRLTGPTAYTSTIARILAHHPHRLVDGHDQLGLDYNVYARSDQTHVQAFGTHYSQQTVPVVRMGAAKRQLSRMYGLAQYCHDHLHARRSAFSRRI